DGAARANEGRAASRAGACDAETDGGRSRRRARAVRCRGERPRSAGPGTSGREGGRAASGEWTDRRPPGGRRNRSAALLVARRLARTGLRERLAELRQQSGEWRAALAVLRETEALFPDDKPDIHTRLQASFAALLRNEAVDRLPPLDLVTLVDENADLLPGTPDGEAMQARLADRLLALDLPKR